LTKFGGVSTIVTEQHLHKRGLTAYILNILQQEEKYKIPKQQY